jgi:hypothetical protein
MRSPAMARRFGEFSATVVAGAAVLVFHTAAFAQQKDANKDNDAKDTAAKKPAAPDASKKATEPSTAAPAAPAGAVHEAAPAPTAAGAAKQPAPEAEEEMPPGYSPPPGYRQAPPPHGYPQPPAEEPEYYYGPYHHGYYYGPPPPPYGYPPPRYYRRHAPPPPPPVGYYPEPISYRPFFFGFGIGVSGLGEYPNQGDARSRVGFGYTMRLGFGLSPHWSLVLAADGATAYFHNMNISETVFTVGPQVFLSRKLYVRAGIGAASRTYEYDSYYNDYSGYYYSDSWTDSGMGAVAAIGMEFFQGYHVSLAVEANGTVGYYPNRDQTGTRDTLSTFGINFVMNLF